MPPPNICLFYATVEVIFWGLPLTRPEKLEVGCLEGAISVAALYEIYHRTTISLARGVVIVVLRS